MTGAKTKDIKARLGDPKTLQSTDQAKAFIAERLEPKVKAWAKAEQDRAEKKNLAMQFQRDEMVQRHRSTRDHLKTRLEDRWINEERERAARTPTGMRGLWGWITGKNRKIRQENEAEIKRAQERDLREKQAIIQRQLEERRNLQRQVVLAREQQEKRLSDLNRDVAKYMMMGGKAPIEITKTFDQERKRIPRTPDRNPDRDRDRSNGPDFEPN